MNLTSKLSLALFLLAAPLGLRAVTAEQAYLNLYLHREHWAGPLPVEVRFPSVSEKFAGQHLLLEFIVGANGRPNHFQSCTPGADPDLVETVERAVRRWEFTPGLQNGVPTNYRVTLPVEIVAWGDK